jgi:hypothetical protein
MHVFVHEAAESVSSQRLHCCSGAPRANAIAERCNATVHRECLDHLSITGPRHVRRVCLRTSSSTTTTHRPQQHPPASYTPTGSVVRQLRRERLARLVPEYVQVA